MKKFLTKGAATAFLIAASTSSVFAQQNQGLDSTISVGVNIEPIFYLGNIFNKIEYQKNGETDKLSDKSVSFAIRASLPDFTFAITEQLKIGVKLFGQYNASYTQDCSEVNVGDITLNSKNAKTYLENRQLTISGYAFGVKTEAEFCFFSGDDMSMGIALGPVLQYNHVDVERKDKKTSDSEDMKKAKSNYWSLDASIGLKMAYNISESLQLRAGVFYETANLAKFGSKVSSDKLNLDGDEITPSVPANTDEAKKVFTGTEAEKKELGDKVKAAADKTDNGDKNQLNFDSIAHKIVLSVGLHFAI